MILGRVCNSNNILAPVVFPETETETWLLFEGVLNSGFTVVTLLGVLQLC